MVGCGFRADELCLSVDKKKTAVAGGLVYPPGCEGALA